MHDACPDWEVPEEGWRLIEPCLSLPDVNDRHVLAAAVTESKIALRLSCC